MILAAVDDLLFASKIRATAKRLGREVVFARSGEAARGHAGAESPHVIVVDLDSPRIDGVATITALKADQALSGVSIVGFVSHVRADLVDAARRAGADRVYARSAFVAQLDEILSGVL